MNQLQNQRRLRNAGLSFVDPARNLEPAAIQEAIQALNEGQDWAKAHHFLEDENDALWSLHKGYSRIGCPAQAIDSLQALRTNLEKMRRQIFDPYERAGLLTTFPNLFPALCRLLYETGRFEELLGAIEGAKGRVLSDVMAEKRNPSNPDSLCFHSTGRLVQLVQEIDGHYLSYFVDEETIYAVFVARDGSIHANAIPIDRVTLQKWAKSVDPKRWVTPLGGLFGTPMRLDGHLTPLVEWLEPLAVSRLIREGDHICYSPDAELHLIPLHYATFLGEPLVKHVSLSRIQGAGALLALLEEDPGRPTQYTAVQVPTQQDAENGDKLTDLSRVPGWLAQTLPGDTLIGERADIDHLPKLAWSHRLVHFATHGTFPERDDQVRNQNPFDGSGLLLAKNGNLPSSTEIGDGKVEMLLTPEKVLHMDFSGSHVTMQACVSGLAKEGIGGDALGLEWALLQMDARSLLATHWNVPADASADFCIRFYEKWLSEKKSRAQAWREAMLELTEQEYDGGEPEPYYWGGFSLSGDWR